jgi:biopolymer transport protein ExbB/TolQ
LLFCWSLAILFTKWRKLRLQRKALDRKIVDVGSEFTLSPGSAQDLLLSIRSKVDDPRNFMLLNRIALVLSNLKNTGARSDVSEMLRSQAEIDEAQMESSYGHIRGFVWSIPILGFIGTVLGLSEAIGSFGSMLSSGSGEILDIKAGLQQVTGGLATAFDTTLLALVAALVTQLLITMLKKKEEMFLDECNEFCQEHIVNRVRLGHLAEG